MAMLSDAERDEALAALPGWTYDAERDAHRQELRLRRFRRGLRLHDPGRARGREGRPPSRMVERLEQGRHLALAPTAPAASPRKDIALARGSRSSASRPGLPCGRARLLDGRAFQGMRSGGRVVEGARLESEYTPKAYRGFESLPLRHLLIFHHFSEYHETALSSRFQAKSLGHLPRVSQGVTDTL